MNNSIFRRTALLFLSFVSIAAVRAQVISDPLSNKPYYSSPSDRSGSPLILPDWGNGTILSENGTRYKGIQVNFDALQKAVVFKIEENIYLFNEPVKEFTVDNNAEGRTRLFVRSDNVHPQIPASFVEVLASGKNGLYKLVSKSVVELTDYNSVARKVIEEKKTYFFVREGKLQQVVLNKKGVQEIQSVCGTGLEAFMREQGLSGKSEADWIKLIEYCNSTK